MAGSDRRSADEALVLALAVGRTAEDAARLAHVGIATVYRRRHDAAFMARVAEARRGIWEDALGQATDACTAAVRTLRALLDDRVAMARLGAARCLLETVATGIKTVELEHRLAEIEAQLAALPPGLHRVV